MIESEHHVPVLLSESIEYLNIIPDGIYFDATLGFGGHSSEILKNLNKTGKLIAVDKDDEALKYCDEKFSGDERIKTFKTSFVDIENIARMEFIDNFDGILADLGVSSFQLDTRSAGFTFREDAPLDLRMDKSGKLTAADILNNFSEKNIADIFFQYGEERKSKLIANKICIKRRGEKFLSSLQLKKLVSEFVPERFLNKTLSRLFQAMRIYINNELEELKLFLDLSVRLLKPQGRIVILSYHSLEDRIVKEKFKFETISCICPPESPICTCDKQPRLKIITKKPVTPTEKEIKFNNRARSGKLRCAEKI